MSVMAVLLSHGEVLNDTCAGQLLCHPKLRWLLQACEVSPPNPLCKNAKKHEGITSSENIGAESVPADHQGLCDRPAASVSSCSVVRKQTQLTLGPRMPA